MGKIHQEVTRKDVNGPFIRGGRGFWGNTLWATVSSSTAQINPSFSPKKPRNGIVSAPINPKFIPRDRKWNGISWFIGWLHHVSTKILMGRDKRGNISYMIITVYCHLATSVHLDQHHGSENRALTLSQTTNFRLFQTEKVYRRQFQI